MDKVKEKQKIYRIIDANLNRSREGLRVCEEVVRFIFNDTQMTETLRELRHSISRAAIFLPLGPKGLLNARDIRFDVGKIFSQNNKRGNFSGVFIANMRRSQEALRALEEFSHILDKKSSNSFRRIRFQLYEAEKKIGEKFPTLSNTG